MSCDESASFALSLLSVTLGFQVIGLGLYQAGAQSSKFTNTILIALLNMVLGSILWYSVGYSLVFGQSQKGFIGSPSMAFFIAVSSKNCSSQTQSVPDITMATFEMFMALCAPFIFIAPWSQFISTIGAICLFVVWPIFVYYPLSHWIHGGGWLHQLLVIDYAGSLTVHTSSGMAGLIITKVLQSHVTMETTTSRFHANIMNHTIFTIGALATILGWFLFNLGAVGMIQRQSSMGLAVINTYLSASTSCLCCGLVSGFVSSQCLYSDLITGMIAGVVGMSAAPASMQSWAAVVVGMLVGTSSSLVYSCLYKYAPTWINGSKVDFPYTHGIPGVLGSVAAGLFTDPGLDMLGRKGGFYSNGRQFGVQVLGVLVAVTWSALFTYLIIWFIHLTVGFNISKNQSIGISQDKPNHSDYRSKLFAAIINGQATSLEDLAARHVNFNIKNFDYQTPLLLASSYGHIQCVKFILRQPNIDIHAKDRWGSTALVEAIKHGHDRVVQCLIRHGCSWTQDGAGNVLCGAVGRNDLEEVARLVAMGMDVNSVNHSNGSYAIHLASKLGSRVVVQYLIDQRADINAVDSSGHTPLNYSDMHEHRAVSQLLEGLGARRVSHHYSVNEICEVATSGNLQMMRHMVHNGASVCYRDCNHRTPLHVSATEGHLDVVKFLVLQPGIDINGEDKTGSTPLLDSIVNNHYEVAEFLKSHGGTVNECKLGLLMTEMAKTGDIRNLKRMLRWTGQPNVFDFDGNTCLHVASINGRADVVVMLLREGAGSVVAMLAISHQQLDVEKELRKYLKSKTEFQEKIKDNPLTSCYQRPSKIPRRNYKTNPSTYHYQPRDSWSSTDISLEQRHRRESKTAASPAITPSLLHVMPVSQLSPQTRELAGGKPDYV